MSQIARNAQETRLRDKIALIGKSLFERGLTAGSSGNISVRLPDSGWLMTPTNVSLGSIEPAQLSKIHENGQLIEGPAPTKEAFLHRAMYDERPSAGAIIHLHATYAAAVSCMVGLNCDDCLPPLTAYYVMKIGRLPLIPYHRPGDPSLGDAIRSHACKHCAVLLANHGPVVSGDTLDTASYAIEELEETAKIFLLLRGLEARPLTPAQIDDLDHHFKK